MTDPLHDALFAPLRGQDCALLFLPDEGVTTASEFQAMVPRSAHALRVAGLEPGDRVAVPGAFTPAIVIAGVT